MKFQVERELHRQELMRERERKMVEDKFEQLKPAMQRAPLTKRQIAVVSLHERLAGHPHACRVLFFGALVINSLLDNAPNYYLVGCVTQKR